MAKFGGNDLAIKPGWVKTYRTHHLTREYTGTAMDFVLEGFSVAAGSYRDAPDIPKHENLAIVRSSDGKKWEYVDDFRGKTVFNTDNQFESIVDYIGEIKDGFTLLEPKTPFDRWDGGKWVTDEKAIKEAQIAEANAKKSYLIDEAEKMISLFERKVRLEMATDEDKSRLHEWEVYSVKLSEVDTSTIPNIDWPKKPE